MKSLAEDPRIRMTSNSACENYQTFFHRWIDLIGVDQLSSRSHQICRHNVASSSLGAVMYCTGPIYLTYATGIPIRATSWC